MNLNAVRRALEEGYGDRGVVERLLLLRTPRFARANANTQAQEKPRPARTDAGIFKEVLKRRKPSTPGPSK